MPENTVSLASLVRTGAYTLLSVVALFPAPLLAQAQRPASTFRFMDLVSLLILGGVGILIWQWYKRLLEEQDTKRLLQQILAERRAAPIDGGGTKLPDEDGAGLISRLEELKAAQSRHGLVFEGMQEALIMAISRLEELRKDAGQASFRQGEMLTNAQESNALARALHKTHKDTTTTLERLHVTQSSMLSALEALKASDRRDSTVLAELRAGMTRLNGRLMDLIEPDQSSDPTVIGEPDATPRAPARADTGPEPVKELLEAQQQMLAAQQEALEAQNAQLARLVEQLEGLEESRERHLEERAQERELLLHGNRELSAQLEATHREDRQALTKLTDQLRTVEQSVRQLHMLEDQADALSAQLGELQADIGLVLKARPVRGAGRSRSPYDVQLAEEYYANLQKLVRVLVKNDKASGYALEAIQYLYESLQVQSSLCELLSSSEFALRVSPQALRESVVNPLLEQLGHKPMREPAGYRNGGNGGYESRAGEEEALAELRALEPSHRETWEEPDDSDEAEELEEDALPVSAVLTRSH